MEHKQATKAYTNILKLLPKSSVVNFQNPIYSPSRDKRSADHHHQNKHKSGHTGGGKGYSGPIMSTSLVPAEARRNMKNNKLDGGVAYQEPTSPKISCMGQIKHKHKKKFDKAKSFSVVAANAKAENTTTGKVIACDTHDNKESTAPKKHHHPPSVFKRMFTMTKRPPVAHQSRKSFDHQRHVDQIDKAPGLSQLKRFASGRDTLASFDWTTADLQHQINRAPETDRGTYTYTCRQKAYHDDDYDDHRDDDDEGDDDFIIPFSAPIAVVKGVALQPRKEVNLWKRRTMNPPSPLQLN